MLVADLSQLPPEVRMKIDEIFRHDHQVRFKRAMEEQQAMAAEFEQHRPRSSDGLGEQTMALHPYIDACNRAVVGSVRWSNDEDLRRWYLRKYPAARVKSTGTRCQSGWQPPEPTDRTSRAGQIITVASGHKRFTRVYA